jgi:hypothetical protein
LKNFRLKRMLPELRPLFEGESEQTVDFHSVFGCSLLIQVNSHAANQPISFSLQLLDTWHLYVCLTSPSPAGFGRDTKEQVSKASLGARSVLISLLS